MSKPSNLLTSDNLPALFREVGCMHCSSSGVLNTSDGDPINDVTCPDCDGSGKVPYPGDFIAQRRDFLSEVIAPIADALLDVAQEVMIMYDPNTQAPFSFRIGPASNTPMSSTSSFCQPDLETAVMASLDKLRVREELAAERAQLAADVEAFRKQRALELGLPAT